MIYYYFVCSFTDELRGIFHIMGIAADETSLCAGTWKTLKYKSKVFDEFDILRIWKIKMLDMLEERK